MKSKLAIRVALLGCLVIGTAARAHHSFPAVFDGSRTIDVTGTVTEFRFVNPHSTMTMEVADEGGATRTLVVEFDGQLNLIHGGWTADTIQVGERLTVHGNPSRSETGRIWFLRLTRPDGSQLMRPRDETQNAIDEQRRRRAQQRDQQNQP